MSFARLIALAIRNPIVTAASFVAVVMLFTTLLVVSYPSGDEQALPVVEAKNEIYKSSPDFESGMEMNEKDLELLALLSEELKAPATPSDVAAVEEPEAEPIVQQLAALAPKKTETKTQSLKVAAKEPVKTVQKTVILMMRQIVQPLRSLSLKRDLHLIRLSLCAVFWIKRIAKRLVRQQGR